MRTRISTIIGVSVVLYLGIFLLNSDLGDIGLAQARHIRRYQFEGDGVAAVPFGRLILRAENGSVTIDRGQTVTSYRFISGTWEGRITGDGSSWRISGLVKDPAGKEYNLEFIADKVVSTSEGDLFAVRGTMKNDDDGYSLHYHGTINARK